MTDPDTTEKVEEDLKYLSMCLRDARRALWDGKTGKAFAAVEAAEEECDELKEALENAN